MHKMAANEANVNQNIAAQNEQAGQIDVDEDPNMVQWRGNLVTEKEAKALRHVFDNLQDHFGHQRPDPRVRFNHVSLAHPGHGQKWHGDVDFTYEIDGDHCKLNYIGMDVCIDLAPKLVHKHGQPLLNDYGSTWLYVYLPQLSIDKVKSYVKAGTGWDVSDEGFIDDTNRNMVAIKVKLCSESGQPEPSFWVVKDKDASGGRGSMSFSRIGSVQEVAAQPHQQRIHRGIGIFSISMEVDGTSNLEPTPGTWDEANLSFTLVSARTWGVTDCVAPIVYAPSKRHLD
uniref:Uncharacterized protein n=1 Tax=Skeletonema marinoi TaxID=267567 RepID=A0A7S2M1Q8_9STRA|mmetsp:Transcript_3393/g.5713  ORF Transcript_3393/g.5713 Transcript_3393/m.5713 type:complete len:285 (+) Transcript_3393:61-915(+)